MKRLKILPELFLYSTLSLSFCLLTMTVGCTHDRSQIPGPDPVQARQLPAAEKVAAGSVVQSNTAFACDLYQQLKTNQGNLFLSPYSISTGLAMTWAGAKGQTGTEMAQVLHFDLSQSALHPAFGALQQSLDTGTTFGGYELDIANQLWGQQGRSWSSGFLNTLKSEYEAPLKELDFTANPESARQEINTWVAGETGGKIQDLMPSASIDSSTVVVLADAIYFKGRWNACFDKAYTQTGTFHLNSSSTVTVPFMLNSASYPHKTVDGVQVLEMPYQGKDISMIILLPVAVDGLSDLESNLTPEHFSAWTSNLTSDEVMLSFPKFSFTSDFSLKDTLSAMGMPSAFSSSVADFSGMDGSLDIYLQSVMHKAYVAVDEEGTVAAAATGISGAASAPTPFRVDHPFLFVILDRVTGSELFMGRVIDPS